MEIGAEPVSGPDGVVGAIVVTVRDVCDRKKRDLALEDAAKVNGIIYNESLAGIIRVTVDGRIVDCNDALVRMLGYSTKQDLLSLRAPRIYFDPSDRNRILRLLSTSRRLSEHEICFRRQDGSRCWVLLNARMLDAPPGEVGGTIVSTVVDISQRKIQEEILRQSEQRFAAFMHHLPGIAFIKDLDGRYVYYNEAAWHLFHIRPEAIVGKTDEDIWSPAGPRNGWNPYCTPMARTPGSSTSSPSSNTNGSPWSAALASISPSAPFWRNNSARPAKWKRWAGWPAAWRTISITC